MRRSAISGVMFNKWPETENKTVAASVDITPQIAKRVTAPTPTLGITQKVNDFRPRYSSES
jgi:hypothetical protein